MAGPVAGSKGFRCAVCGCQDFVPLARRSDGTQVVRCTKCGMGVIDPIPADLMALYEDDYYGEGQPDTSGSADQWYADYAFTAEHGVGWAAAMVKLLLPSGGRVLDIGCAHGQLLEKIGPRYTRFGIEANVAAGLVAANSGVVLLGRDLLDPGLTERHANSFDAITAIAVFEHLGDIRAAMEAALGLLRDDGVLLFELPLMSTDHDNTVWFTSSLEHVWYPSERGVRHLVQTELGAELVGTEVVVTGYGSTYIGLVFRGAANGKAIRDLAARVVLRSADATSSEEATARMLLHLVHAATTTHADIGILANLPPTMLNPPLLRRFSELWQGDLWSVRLARIAAEEARASTRRLQADLDAAESDRLSTYTELTAGLVFVQARLDTANANLAALSAMEISLNKRMAGLHADRAAADGVMLAAQTKLAEAQARLDEVRAIQASAGWRIAAVLKEATRRYPRLAIFALRVARVLWWTLRGRLISRLRLRHTIRAEIRDRAAAQNALLEVPSLNSGQDTVLQQIHSAPGIGRDVFLLDETGHRSPLPARQERADDWPLVSVVITSFNHGQFVADAVDSVLAQTFKDLEVIVVEDGSTDPAARLEVARLQRPRTRVLMQGAGHRAGANRNFGISQARGRYICCLDADDTLAPTYIEKAVFLLERHRYDVVSSAMQMAGSDHGQVDIMEKPDLEALLEGNQVITCAVFRQSLWEQAGGYRDVDPTRSGYVDENWAFWIRLAALGARFRNLAHDPMMRHRVHPASLSREENVFPMAQQREIVRQINLDVLQPIASRLALSKRRASIRYGTPSAPPAPIILCRTRPDGHPPTLLLAMPFLILGGGERLLSAVVGHLVEMGWRVVITTSVDPGTGHGDTTPWFERYSNEIFHLPRGLPPNMREDFIHHLVHSRGVDVVWVVGSALAYDCLRGLRAAHPRLRVADLLFNTVGHTANNRRRRALIDLIFVENNDVRDWLLARGEEANRIRLVESGVDLAVLQPMERSTVLIQQIGATANDLIVGFSGRWSEEKNPLGFIQIARLVDAALPVRFVMTGTGHLRPAIEQAIHEAGFPEGRFYLLGDVPEIAPVLASFDLLVVPSVLDGRPVVVLEALSMGVPVLASRVGALPELIKDGKTGWLCEPNDHASFAQCIVREGRKRSGLREMRGEARLYAEAQLDIQGMFDAYRIGLESLLLLQKGGGHA
jgi:glycosyltransferase involved in cell wall biosynthesis/SAM-dependent methyltransferase